jgi:rhombotail lipoprotein
MRKLLIAMLAMVLATGCYSARGFDRGALREQMGLATPEITDQEIEKTLSRTPQLKFPIRLAVYFMTPQKIQYDWRSWDITWDDHDKSSLLSMAEDLKSSGIVSDIVIVSDTLVTRGEHGITLKDIRLAAARYTADAVLIVRGAAEVDMDSNILSILYLTIVGCWLAPGTRCDALFMTDAVLLDIRNEYLYLSEETEATDHAVKPVALLKETVIVANAKRKAVGILRRELLQRLKNLKG